MSSDPGRRRSSEVIPLERGRSIDETMDLTARAPKPKAFVRPSQIGRYIVLDTVGMGAMGVVCSAYDPKLDRKVALKLLLEREGPRDRGTHGRARLVREAQALARLRHPNVVTVHDVDVADGHVFVAMEYVEGTTIEDWLAAERRSWREILAVYLQAGEGLAAAHEAGIVHRDFKPGNVRIGADGRVCVLDFGLAMRAEPTELSRSSSSMADGEIMEVISEAAELKLTRDGGVVGTPAYMAPEQALGGASLGPPADQFAFAVALFEAFYQHLPFGEDDLLSVFRRIQLGEITAVPRDTSVPPYLHRALLRALQATPSARWPSMRELLFALRNDPAKRRRRIVVAIGGIVLATGSAASAWALRGQEAACVYPSDRLAGVWDDARREAITTAFAVTELTYAPDVAARTTARLDAWASDYAATWTAICEATHATGDQSDALLDARMGCLDARRREVGALVAVLGEADHQMVDRAIDVVHGIAAPVGCATYDPAQAGVPIPDDPAARVAIAQAQELISRGRALLGAGRYPEAAEVSAQAVAHAQGVHPPTTADARLVAARAARHSGDAKRAEELLRAAVTEAAASSAPQLEVHALTQLAFVLGVDLQRVDEALSLGIAVDAALARAGDVPEVSAEVAGDRAAIEVAAGRFAEAEETSRRAVALAEEAFGEVHPRTAGAIANLAIAFIKQGRPEEAEREFRRVLEISERLHGSDHPQVASNARNLGNVLLEGKGDLDQAQQLFERALAIRESAFGPDDPRAAEIRIALVDILRRRGDLRSAETLSTQALESMRRGDPNHWRVAVALNNRGLVLLAAGRATEAVRDLQEAEQRLSATIGPDHPITVQAVMDRARAALALRRWDEAIEHAERAVAVMMEVHDGPHVDRSAAQRILALALAGAGRRAQAIDLAREALAELRTVATKPSDLADARFDLAAILWDDAATRGEAEALMDEVDAARADLGFEVLRQIQEWRKTHPRPHDRR